MGISICGEILFLRGRPLDRLFSLMNSDAESDDRTIVSCSCDCTPFALIWLFTKISTNGISLNSLLFLREFGNFNEFIWILFAFTKASTDLKYRSLFFRYVTHFLFFLILPLCMFCFLRGILILLTFNVSLSICSFLESS